MLKSLSLIAITFVSFVGISQDLEYTKIEWDENPTWVELDTAQIKEQEVVTRFNEISEFTYSAKYNNNLVEYFTRHKKVRVFSDYAIQNNNKVYIAMSRTVELIDARARVITPDGLVINLDKSNIKESDGGDGLGAYNYFAIDGVVNGSDIEYTYTAVKVPEVEGGKFSIDNEGTTYNVGFTLISPDNLVFAVKSYNGFPEMEKDESDETRNIFRVKIDSLGAMPDEKYSARDRYLPSLVYKLDKNTYNGKSNIVSFAEITRRIFERYHPVIDKGSVKKMTKLLNDSGAMGASTTEQKIRILESYLKNTIGIIDGVPSKTIKEILKDGYTSESGMVMMIITGLDMMGIEHEIVLAGNRYYDFFDKDFENYTYLNHLMLYIPDVKKYMAPDEQSFRLGMVPASWTNQEALFIRTKTIGELKTGVGKVKFVEPTPMSLTHDDMVVNVVLADLSAPIIEFKRALSGYSSVYFQGFYKLIDEDGKKELDQSLISFADENGEVIEYKVSGVEEADAGVNPMVYEGKMKATTLLEKAGNRYLFKVGQLIGPQAEMYEEEKRTLDIEHDHNMVYDRTITFEIPDGYELSGLDELSISEVYPLENPTIQFVSNYVLEGNKVTVHVIESYERINFGNDEIDEFRRIINAAANFNKIVLFLIKKD